MARDEKHAKQIRAWKEAHAERVRELDRKAAKAYRQRQKQRRSDALRATWAEREGARKEAQEEDN